MTGSVTKSPEACFNQGLLDTPARIELRGFEVGGGKLPATLIDDETKEPDSPIAETSSSDF
jgi:hypothetical protein